MAYNDKTPKQTVDIDLDYTQVRKGLSNIDETVGRNKSLFKQKTETDADSVHPNKQNIETENPLENANKTITEISDINNLLTKAITSTNIVPSTEDKSGPKVEITTVGDDTKKVSLVTEKATKDNVVKLTQEVLDVVNQAKPEKDKITIEEYTELAVDLAKRNTNVDGTINSDNYQKEALILLNNLFQENIKESTVLTENFATYTKETNPIADSTIANPKVSTSLNQDSEEKMVITGTNGSILPLYAKTPTQLDADSQTKLVVVDQGTKVTVPEFSKQSPNIADIAPQTTEKNLVDADFSKDTNTYEKQETSNNEDISNTEPRKSGSILLQNPFATPNTPNTAPEYLKRPIPLNNDNYAGMTAISAMIALYNSIPLYTTNTIKTFQNMAANPLSMVTSLTTNPTGLGTIDAKITDFNLTLSPEEITKLSIMIPKTIPLLKGVNIKTVNNPQIYPNGAGTPYGPPFLRNDSMIENNFRWYKNRIFEQRNKFAEAPEGATGYILVESPVRREKIWKIPFQFTPKIGAQNLETNYQNERILNRIGEIYTFTGVGNMNLSVETEFFALSPGPIGLQAESFWTSKNQALIDKIREGIKKIYTTTIPVSDPKVLKMSEDVSKALLQQSMTFYEYWNQDLVDTLMYNLRALQLPSYSSLYFNPPPIVSLDFGPNSNILKKPVFTEGTGNNANKTFQLQNRTFVVKSVEINQDISDQGSFPTIMYPDDDMLLNIIRDFIPGPYLVKETQIVLKIQNMLKDVARSLVTTGFKARMELIEVNINIHKIPPSFEEYWGYAESYKNDDIRSMTDRPNPAKEADEYRTKVYKNKPKEAADLKKLKQNQDNVLQNENNIAQAKAAQAKISVLESSIESQVLATDAIVAGNSAIFTYINSNLTPYLSAMYTDIAAISPFCSNEQYAFYVRYYNYILDEQNDYLQTVTDVSQFNNARNSLNRIILDCDEIFNYDKDNAGSFVAVTTDTLAFSIKLLIQSQQEALEQVSILIAEKEEALNETRKQLREAKEQAKTYNSFFDTPKRAPELWPYRS